MKKYNIEWDKTATVLYGNTAGKKCFDDLKINFDDEVIIVIPEHIELIVSSFIVGFTKKKGALYFREHVVFETVNPLLKTKIYEELDELIQLGNK
jgi:hypothetical protein